MLGENKVLETTFCTSIATIRCRSDDQKRSADWFLVSEIPRTFGIHDSPREIHNRETEVMFQHVGRLVLYKKIFHLLFQQAGQKEFAKLQTVYL